MTLLSHLLEVSLGTSAVILLLLLLRPVLERFCSARWRCWVWLVLALRLALPWSWSGPWSPLHVTFPDPGETPAYSPVTEEYSMEMSVGDEVTYLELGTGEWTVDTGVESRTDLAPLEGTGFSAGVDRAAEHSLNVGALLFLLWAAGAVGMLLWHTLAYLRFAKRVRRWSRPAGQYEGIPVVECLAAETPLLLGWLQPTIVLPRGMEGEDRDFALLHEYTHCGRGDLWRKLLLLVANALHWFNPLVWLLRRAGERDLEMACDEAVLEGKDLEYRQRYGAALLHTVTARAGAEGALTTGFAQGMGGLRRRFAALVDGKHRPLGRSVLAVAIVLALAGSALASCSEGPQAAVQDSVTPIPAASEPPVGETALQPGSQITMEEADIWSFLGGCVLQGYNLEERTIEVLWVETTGSGLLYARTAEDLPQETLHLASQVRLDWDGNGNLAEFLAWPSVSGESLVLFCERNEAGEVTEMGWVPCFGSCWTGVVWARYGTWDGESRTFTFQPLAVDQVTRTWSAREDGWWSLSLGENPMLPPISLYNNGTTFSEEAYLRSVFREEPLENSQGDCLLRLTVVDNAIVEALWMTPYQPAS